MYFKGENVLVIGGTGTIGKSLVKGILKQQPNEIRIFSRDEYKQQRVRRELSSYSNIHFIIGDIREYDSLVAAMHGVDYVLHLAAMKQVDSCEYNPMEAVRTNIIGTNNVIMAARAQQVKKVIITSSDKAISPTNTYGATKLIGERLISASNNVNSASKTIVASVRFGNVLGSRGSVIPLLKKQIIEEKKVTITDEDMTRFMMTLTQATELTLKALMEAKGGEVFVLKMPTINIGVLARVIMEKTCDKHSLNKRDIDIEIIGRKAGEKMYEELMTIDESENAWELPDMYIIPNKQLESNRYPNMKKAVPGSYSSENQKPLDSDELRLFLEKENLI